MYILYAETEQTGMEDHKLHALMTCSQLDASQAPPISVNT